MGQREAHFSLDFAANTEWAMQLRLAPALLQQLERASAGSEACTLQFAEGGKHVRSSRSRLTHLDPALCSGSAGPPPLSADAK